MTGPTRNTSAGRAYLDLQKIARKDRRPTDELLQLYVLEAFLDRLGRSSHADRFVLKGGVLLAAFGERRPTRDIDLQANALDRDADHATKLVREIGEISVNDGVIFDTTNIRAETIRDDEVYPGIRVTLAASLATAHLHFHVDINIGDVITPSPEEVRLPRLLGGALTLRAYPLAMIYAEKIVTASIRGTTNTRWRDFADVYLLSRHHAIDSAELSDSIAQVAAHRQVVLEPLHSTLEGYAVVAQQKWSTWCRKQQLQDRLPNSFDGVLDAVIGFADPAIKRSVDEARWDPTTGCWS